MNLSNIMKNLFKGKSKINLSEPIFYSNQFMQTGYDREIDEGMSSGLGRYVTLDVTVLSEKQLDTVLDLIIDKAKDFNLCKVVQVTGFTTDNKKYFAVSGETHALYVGSSKESMHDDLKPVIDKFSMKVVSGYVPFPVKAPEYKTTNLGPYGSTGCPIAGIPINSEAKKLRDEGKIY